MSTTQVENEEENGDLEACDNGREFAREYLKQADSPVAPVELSDEYDCSRGYMQDVLAENDEFHRVARGKYVLSSEVEGANGSNGDSGVLGDFIGQGQGESGDGEEREDSRGLADFIGNSGGGREEPENGGDSGTVEEDMPTKDEYERFKQVSVDDGGNEEVEEDTEPVSSMSGNGMENTAEVGVPTWAVVGAVGAVVALYLLYQMVQVEGTEPEESDTDDSGFAGLLEHE